MNLECSRLINLVAPGETGLMLTVAWCAHTEQGGMGKSDAAYAIAHLRDVVRFGWGAPEDVEAARALLGLIDGDPS